MESNAQLNVLLLGKKRAGKTVSGNTILGREVFMSEKSSKSVTRDVAVKSGTVNGSVTVVDTPGFFDTQLKPEELMTEIARSVYLSSPGPHAFLIVFRVIDRFTEQEQQIPQMIEMMFGQDVLQYSIILFTHRDQLKGQNIENLTEENCALRHLLGRFHVFNNEIQNSREQVNDLLQKTDSMIEQKGGGHYSNQMFEDAQRFRREEEKRRQREILKEEVERQSENPEFKNFLTKYQPTLRLSTFALGRNMVAGEFIGMCIGGAVGAACGLIGGPAGAAVGVFVGGAVGVAVGAIVHASAK
uniref:AIG1-type G domain-containing protein n=1 Tax=Sinocyclocheilus anshuiensis TaxID=1608454 RepID=A0A671NW04_9TELE